MSIVVAPENAVTLAAFSIVPNRVVGGSAAIGTVTLNRPAPFGGAQVGVEAQRRNIVTVPNTVFVPEGATTASFTIATAPLHGAREKTVEIVAVYNNVSASAPLTVLPSGQAAKTRAAVALCASLTTIPCVTQSAVRTVAPLGGRDGEPPPPTTATLFETQYTLYSPELALLSETAPSSATTAAIAYDYIWFGSQPLAQIENATGNIRWYFNDHLGTPTMQTDTNGRVFWQAEYEPYGTIYAVRRGGDETIHQPLRLPGQTAEEGTDLYQNVFRWYRAGWGRYTQPDPVDFMPIVVPTKASWNNSFGYVKGRPTKFVDSLGLDIGQQGPSRQYMKCMKENCVLQYESAIKACDEDKQAGINWCVTKFVTCAKTLGPLFNWMCKRPFQVCLANMESDWRWCADKAAVEYGDCVANCCKQ